MFGALPFISWDFCFSAVALKKNWELGRKKIDLDCFYIHLFGLKKFFLNFEFILCLK
jgi:hypothetical protein